MLRANFHTHTNLCDGVNSPEEITIHAISLGFKQLGFSGHIDPDIHMDIQEYIKIISSLKEKYKKNIDILLGIELDNMYDPKYSDFVEYTIGSTHFLDINSEKPLAIDLTKEQFVYICKNYFESNYYKMSRAYYDLVAKTYDRLHCTFIGHFDLITRFNDELYVLDENSNTYLYPALNAMKYLCEQSVPFEINCGAYNRNRKQDVYPNKRLLSELCKMGGRIIINSDAHQKELLNGGFDFAIKQAIDCGFKYTNILKHNS